MKGKGKEMERKGKEKGKEWERKGNGKERKETIESITQERCAEWKKG